MTTSRAFLERAVRGVPGGVRRRVAIAMIATVWLGCETAGEDGRAYWQARKSASLVKTDHLDSRRSELMGKIAHRPNAEEASTQLRVDALLKHTEQSIGDVRKALAQAEVRVLAAVPAGPDAVKRLADAETAQIEGDLQTIGGSLDQAEAVFVAR